MKWFKNYRYKGLTLVFLSALLTVFLSGTDFLNQAIIGTSSIPIIGSFIAGILYVSASTTAFGVFILLGLSKKIPAIEIAIFAGLGGAVADFVIFRFIKGDLLGEIMPIYNKLGGHYLTRLMKHKSLRWSLPIIGAIIIASPFPDEIGVALMGLSKIKNYQFVLLSFVLDVVGVFLLVSAFSLIK